MSDHDSPTAEPDSAAEPTPVPTDQDTAQPAPDETGPGRPRRARSGRGRKTAGTVPAEPSTDVEQTHAQVPDLILPTDPASEVPPAEPMDVVPEEPAAEPGLAGDALTPVPTPDPLAADPVAADPLAAADISEPAPGPSLPPTHGTDTTLDSADVLDPMTDPMTDPVTADTVVDLAAEPVDPPPVPVEVDISDLVPSTGNLPAESIQYETVVLTDIPTGPDAPGLRPLDRPVNLGDDSLAVYTRAGEGVVVTTRQTWTARGVTLGRLLHSLALAPGESTMVSIVDWGREESGASRELTDQGERLAQETLQNRATDEQAQSALKETQEGASSTASVSETVSAGGSGGFSLGPFGGFGGSASTSENNTIANTVARSSGAREAVMSVAQNISARTEQVASAERTRRAAVVKESSQAESEKVSTRVITNYNHMHAMSVQYYEVVQVYEVTTTPVLIERCVFIPLEILTFTPALLKRYARVLAAVAPPGWARQIEAIDPFATSVSRTRESRNNRAATDQRESMSSTDARSTGEAISFGVSGGVGGTATAKATSAGPGLHVEQAGEVKMKHLAAASDGTVWAINQLGVPVRWNAAEQTWSPAPTQGLPEGGVNRISVGHRGRVLTIDGAGNIYQLNDTAWTTVGGRLTDVSAGATGTAWTDGSVWGVNSENQVFRVAEGNWQPVGTEPMQRVAVVNDGVVWAIRPDGGASQWNAATKSWEQRGGVLAEIAVAADGSVWGVTANHDIFLWKGPNSGWEGQFSQHGAAAKLSAVAPVSANDVWGLTAADGYPVHFSQPTTFEMFDRHSPEGYADSLTVWWDDELIRGIELSVGGASGPTFRLGDTGSGLHTLRHDFLSSDRLSAIVVRSGGTDDGADCVVQIELRTASSSIPVVFGPNPTDPTTDLPLSLRGAGLCGLFGAMGRSTARSFLSSVGFHVRGEAVPDAIIDHLNDNADYYSQAVWANADELTLSRILASYHYTPTEPDSGDESTGAEPASPVPLGACVDPQPVGVTGNYLGFRWHYPSEEARKAWLHKSGLTEGDEASSPKTVVALPSSGVFAEAVLGRSNSAEKLDISRFWNWQDSPIPFGPPTIGPVNMGTRATVTDLSTRALEQQAAQLGQLSAMPDPGLTQAISQSLTAEIFRDMSMARETVAHAQHALSTAGAGEQAAGQNAMQAYQAALQHQQAMSQIAVDAAAKLTPAGQGASAAGALTGGDGGMLAGAVGNLTGGTGGSLDSTVANLAAETTGNGGLADANVSKIGAVLNKVEQVDATSTTRPRRSRSV